MGDYEMVEGTQPTAEKQHEPRVLKRYEQDEITHMMTEIDDGVFVAWTECRQCSKHVKNCKCVGGPIEAEFMRRWRERRFVDSFKTSGRIKDSVPKPAVPDDISDDERDHLETGPDGDARTYDPETGEKLEEPTNDRLQRLQEGTYDAGF